MRRNGVTLYTTVLGSPTRSQRNADLASLLRWGISRYRPVVGRAAGAGVPAAPASATARRAVPIVAAQRRCTGRARSTGRSSSASSPRRRSRCRSHEGQRVGEVRIYSGRRLVARQPLVAARSVAKPAFGGRAGVLRGPNVQSRRETGSRDRHGHAQRRNRPDADGAELPARPSAPREPGADARGREGHQRRARAQAAGRSRRRDRPGRWANRDAHRRGADVGGDPERLRAHRRRVAHVERGRRPDGGHVHGDQRMGPARRARGAGDAAREDQLPRARRRHGRLCRARCRAASRTPSTPRRSASSTGATSRRCSTPKGRRFASASRRRRSSSRRTSERRKGSSARSSATTRTTRWRSTGSPTWAPATS